MLLDSVQALIFSSANFISILTKNHLFYFSNSLFQKTYISLFIYFLFFIIDYFTLYFSYTLLLLYLNVYSL
jgi:hypothetical protein